MARYYPKRKAYMLGGPQALEVTPAQPLFTAEKVILSLFDYSGNWSEPYKKAGYNVIQVDKDLNGQDVRLYNPQLEYVHGILAAPPCTVFSKASGSRPRSDTEMLEAIGCVDAVLRLVFKLRPQFWALENPQGRLKNWLGEPRLKFHPFHYGDPYQKYTYLWGRFNIPTPAQVEATEGDTTTTKGWNMRSRSNTPKGFAQKFFEANQ
jgi:hypothetical protein